MANDGGLIVSPDTKSKTLIDTARVLFRAMDRIGRNFTVKNRKEVYSVPYTFIGDFIIYILACIFPDESISQIDGDVVKHTAAHYKILLL